MGDGRFFFKTIIKAKKNQFDNISFKCLSAYNRHSTFDRILEVNKGKYPAISPVFFVCASIEILQNKILTEISHNSWQRLCLRRFHPKPKPDKPLQRCREMNKHI